MLMDSRNQPDMMLQSGLDCEDTFHKVGNKTSVVGLLVSKAGVGGAYR